MRASLDSRHKAYLNESGSSHDKVIASSKGGNGWRRHEGHRSAKAKVKLHNDEHSPSPEMTPLYPGEGRKDSQERTTLCPLLSAWDEAGEECGGHLELSVEDGG